MTIYNKLPTNKSAHTICTSSPSVLQNASSTLARYVSPAEKNRLFTINGAVNGKICVIMMDYNCAPIRVSQLKSKTSENF